MLMLSVLPDPSSGLSRQLPSTRLTSFSDHNCSSPLSQHWSPLTMTSLTVRRWVCLQDLEGFDDDGRQRTPISEPASRQQSPFKQRRNSGALGPGPLGSGPPAQSNDTNGTTAGSALTAGYRLLPTLCLNVSASTTVVQAVCCNSAQVA